MSELDLGSTSTPATTTAAPAPASTGTGLVLAPPAPVAVIEPAQAAGAIPVDLAKQTELQSKAAAFAAELASMDTRSPAFTQKIDSITSMGDKDMRATAQVSNRMLDRPAAVIKASKGGG
ncbi:MAG: hypothetical protein QOF95_2107, partial [Pseudonocardiales bacterium]|nr:hypothetical protein [Pseudonocardiales bacterium]